MPAEIKPVMPYPPNEKRSKSNVHYDKYNQNSTSSLKQKIRVKINCLTSLETSESEDFFYVNHRYQKRLNVIIP